MCKYFLYSCGWFEFSKHLDTWKHSACRCLYHWDLYCIVKIDFAWKCFACICLWVSSLHVLKERIFVFICTLNLFFRFGLCCFIFPHLLNFPQNYFFQNLFCFSYIFIGGRKLFLQHVLFIGGVVALHRGSCLIFYRE